MKDDLQEATGEGFLVARLLCLRDGVQRRGDPVHLRDGLPQLALLLLQPRDFLGKGRDVSFQTPSTIEDFVQTGGFEVKSG